MWEDFCRTQLIDCPPPRPHLSQKTFLTAFLNTLHILHRFPKGFLCLGSFVVVAVVVVVVVVGFADVVVFLFHPVRLCL